MIWTESYARFLGGSLELGTVERLERFHSEMEDKRNYDRFTTFPSKSSDMVVIRNIRVSSFCPHHLLPIIGKCHIGYIPDGSILGLSKFQRLVDKYSYQPIVQEELTRILVDKITEMLLPLGVACVMECQHLCSVVRGIRNELQDCSTQVLTGKFEQDAVRSEFFSRL